MKRSAPIASLTCPATGRLDEIPYDFLRKRLSILVAHGESASAGDQRRAGERARRLRCRRTLEAENRRSRSRAMRDRIQQHFEEFSSQGLSHPRASHTKTWASAVTASSKDHEAGMTFLGFLVSF